MLGFCAAWCVAAILTPLLLCQPISANWHPSEGHCGSQNPAFISIAAIDIITDLCIMILPLPTIIRLHMPLSSVSLVSVLLFNSDGKTDILKRIGLVVLFSAGILTMIISALRVYNLSRVDYSDLSYTASDSFIWSIIEPTVGLGIACAPMIRSLYGHMFHASQAGKSSQTTRHSVRPKSFHRLTESHGRDLELGDAGRSERTARAEGFQRTMTRDGDEVDDGQTIKVRTDISVTEGPRR